MIMMMFTEFWNYNLTKIMANCALTMLAHRERMTNWHDLVIDNTFRSITIPLLIEFPGNTNCLYFFILFNISYKKNYKYFISSNNMSIRKTIEHRLRFCRPVRSLLRKGLLPCQFAISPLNIILFWFVCEKARDLFFSINNKRRSFNNSFAII